MSLRKQIHREVDQNALGWRSGHTRLPQDFTHTWKIAQTHSRQRLQQPHRLERNFRVHDHLKRRTLCPWSQPHLQSSIRPAAIRKKKLIRFRPWHQLQYYFRNSGQNTSSSSNGNNPSLNDSMKNQMLSPKVGRQDSNPNGNGMGKEEDKGLFLKNKRSPLKPFDEK